MRNGPGRCLLLLRLDRWQCATTTCCCRCCCRCCRRCCRCLLRAKWRLLQAQTRWQLHKHHALLPQQCGPCCRPGQGRLFLLRLANWGYGRLRAGSGSGSNGVWHALLLRRRWWPPLLLLLLPHRMPLPVRCNHLWRSVAASLAPIVGAACAKPRAGGRVAPPRVGSGVAAVGAPPVLHVSLCCNFLLICPLLACCCHVLLLWLPLLLAACLHCTAVRITVQLRAPAVQPLMPAALRPAATRATLPHEPLPGASAVHRPARSPCLLVCRGYLWRPVAASAQVIAAWPAQLLAGDGVRPPFSGVRVPTVAAAPPAWWCGWSAAARSSACDTGLQSMGYGCRPACCHRSHSRRCSYFCYCRCWQPCADDTWLCTGCSSDPAGLLRRLQLHEVVDCSPVDCSRSKHEKHTIALHARPNQSGVGQQNWPR